MRRAPVPWRAVPGARRRPAARTHVHAPAHPAYPAYPAARLTTRVAPQLTPRLTPRLTKRLLARLLAVVIASALAVIGVLGTTTAQALGTQAPTRAASATPAVPITSPTTGTPATSTPTTGTPTTGTPTTGTPTTGTPTTPTISLRTLSPAVSHPGGTLSVTVHIANPTSEPLTKASLELWAGWKQISSRSDLADWASDTSVGPTHPQRQVAIADLEPGTSRDETLTLSIDSLGLGSASRGPRQLAVTLRQDGRSVDVIRTFLLWDPEPDGTTTDAEPVRLSLLAALTGPAVDPADPLNTKALIEPTAPGGTLAQTLAAVSTAEQATGTRGALSVAVDPALVATAAGSNDAQVAAWASAVTKLSDRTGVNPLPPYDPDLAALAHAGLSPNVLRTAVTAPLPGGWTVPATWGPPLAWPAGSDPPDLDTLGAARAAGLSTVLVPAGLEAEPGTPTGLATVTTAQGKVTALVADEQLGEVLTQATASMNGDAPELSAAEATQRLLAEASVVSTQSGADEPHLIAALPRGWTPDLNALRSVLSALTTSGLVQIAPLAEVHRQAAPVVARDILPDVATHDGELAPDEVLQLAGAWAAISSFSSVATKPESLTSLVAPGLAAPASVAWRASPSAERSVAVTTAVDATNALRRRLTVSVVNTEVTLISAEGSLPVTVRNDLPTDVTVTVALRPDDPRLIVDARPTKQVGAGTEARVTVPVRALASGDVAVQVQLLTPDGARAADPVTLHLRVRAGWETVGTGVFAGLVGVLFLFGIWRTVRRGRSPRRTNDTRVPDPLIPGEAERQA